MNPFVYFKSRGTWTRMVKNTYHRVLSFCHVDLFKLALLNTTALFINTPQTQLLLHCNSQCKHYTRADNLSPCMLVVDRIRSLDCPTRSESLYRLSYPSPCSSSADNLPAAKSLTRLDTVSVEGLLVSKRWCFLDKVFTLSSSCIPSRTHHP